MWALHIKLSAGRSLATVTYTVVCFLKCPYEYTNFNGFTAIKQQRWWHLREDNNLWPEHNNDGHKYLILASFH